ncbi:MAG: class I SAM-dependent methyltransferase [Treponema sp.]|nr:class I SAM-dependent methyltransferase [Treponema sp.]
MTDSINKDDYQASLFSNRLSKKYKKLRKWARRSRITCYRLYDRDIPEVPLAADLYEFLPENISGKNETARFMAGEYAELASNNPEIDAETTSRQYLTLYLYERPYEKPDAEENIWLSKMADAAALTIRIPRDHVLIKTRKHDKGGSQYAKNMEVSVPSSLTGIIQEQGQIFRINLTDYLDTGLFFDHRILRSKIRETSSGKAVLNLYCYTAGFSVYAAEGHAKKIDSVDLSNTYLNWAQENMSLNDFTDKEKYNFIRADVKEFITQKKDSKDRYDIIILDPPTFSNSKMADSMLDINRDWADLVNNCIALLAPKGILYFSTNSHRLSFNTELIAKTTDDGCAVHTEDITAATIPEDYTGTKSHRCWKIEAEKIKERF